MAKLQLKRKYSNAQRGNDAVLAIRELYENCNTLLGLIPIGAVMMWPHTKEIPAGWIDLRGQLLAIKDYPGLFALFGTSYGGDGTTTFVLPDFRSIYIAGEGTSATTQAGSVQTVDVGTTGNTLTLRLTRFIIRAA